MRVSLFAAAVAALVVTDPAFAQDYNSNAIIVTGSRRSDNSFVDDCADELRAIGLTRRADFMAQPVRIVSDSREADMREREVYAMMEAAIARAKAAGLELSYGDFELKPVTRENYRELPLLSAGRADTTAIYFLVRVPLTGEVDNVRKLVSTFTKSIPATGRSYLEYTGESSLVIIGPDQYREPVIRKLSEESRKYAGLFGAEYRVYVDGLHAPLEWAQVSETDVFLYIPHRFRIEPGK